MNDYEQAAIHDLKRWQEQMLRYPSAASRLAKRLQDKLNRLVPERVQAAITVAIKQMTRAVLFGAEFLTRQPAVEGLSLQQREGRVRQRIEFYKKVGAAEGGVTGAGGFLLGFADFPLLLALKMKLLFEIAALYGYSVNDYRERLFIMHIFQLAFSGQDHRRAVYLRMINWQEQSAQLPDDIHQLDWHSFQQEYRDYIDLAKMAQLIPGIGAAVGVVANYRLLHTLGTTAVNAYRMRWLEEQARQWLAS